MGVDELFKFLTDGKKKWNYLKKLKKKIKKQI
jgi:hypothetical protein